MSEATSVATVVIPRLNFSRRTVESVSAPVLLQANLGAAGVLGVDALKSQRVDFDFARHRMRITSSARRMGRSSDPNTVVVVGRTYFGRLVLADARADGQKLWVIIDTGSQVSIGNSALRDRLSLKKKLKPSLPVELVSVTGGTIMGNYTTITGLVIGGLNMRNTPVAFADVHPFRKLGLTDRPALLLGMDALRSFSLLSIDFANRTVRFELPATTARKLALSR
jgi:hypothetical protein